MSVNSNLDVDEVALDRKKQEKRSIFSMLKGKAMFYSLRLLSLKKNNMRLKTPTAVVGVRGTKFGVHVYKLDKRTGESRGILLADAGNSIPRLAMGFRPPVQTSDADGADIWNYNNRPESVYVIPRLEDILFPPRNSKYSVHTGKTSHQTREQLEDFEGGCTPNAKRTTRDIFQLFKSGSPADSLKDLEDSAINAIDQKDDFESDHTHE